MFDDGLTLGAEASLDDGRTVIDPFVLPDMLFATAQSENMLAAQKVLGASMLSESRFNAELDVSGDVDKAWRIACNEIAVMLTCSRRTAEVHIEIGDALREFLPLTRAAFAAGELDYARVRKIVDGLTGAGPEAIAALERRILASAHRLPPGQLERDIERQLFAYDPDAAAERRRKMLEHRDVRTRADRHGLAQLQATLSANEAVEALGLINEAAGSVCNRDPRNVSTRRADALVALLHGEQGLTCKCGSETCEAASTPAPSTATSRRKPLLHIVCDLATLLGLTSDPASIDGYGPIDPDFARELAADSTWQALFADFRAQAAGNRPRRQHASTALPLVTRCDRLSREPKGCGDRIRAIQRLVARTPDIVRRSDGHGAQPDPPPGALTYAPGAALAALVRAVDGHCRFPGCSVPANRCQLDHITEFDPSDPRRGGWTIAGNLQCLCRHHHQVKTYRLWTPVMLEDRAIHWTDSTSGLTAVTVPERH